MLDAVGPNKRLAEGSLQAPGTKDLDAAKAFLQMHGVNYVLAQFVDIHGTAKSKSVPVSHFEDILTSGAGFAGGGVNGLALQPHEGEYIVVGDLSTLTLLPWAPGYARVMGTGTVNGQPHALDPRNILARQVARLTERGWVFNAGLEPEFSLFTRKADGGFAPFDASDTLRKPAYDYRGLSRAGEFLDRLTQCLQAVGIDVYQIDHEDANGQYEINFRYADAMSAADQINFFKMAAGEIANELGALCSFMPKPRADITGNGMHVHCSMADAQGRNLFHDESDPSGMGLSKLAYHFTAGLLRHAAALTAILAPSVNSYKRLVVGRTLSGTTWAPVFIAYGDNNRTAMVRIPHGRLEVRTGDSGMNQYLALAAIIAAGLDGIDRELDPGPAHNVNFYAVTPQQLREMQVETLPRNLQEAIDALAESPLLREQLGERFVDEFIALKQDEWTDYHRHVSDWETARYLSFF
jgi:glutamine synthetase